jgi:hypothetical protein
MALEVNQGIFVLSDVGFISYPVTNATLVLQTVTQNGRTAGHLYLYQGNGVWQDIAPSLGIGFSDTVSSPSSITVVDGVVTDVS